MCLYKGHVKCKTIFSGTSCIGKKQGNTAVDSNNKLFTRLSI